MTVINEKFSIMLKGGNDVVDITPKVQGIVKECEAQNGLVNVFVNSPSVSVFITNNELKNKTAINLIDSIIPLNIDFSKDEIKYNPEEYSDIKASTMGHSIAIPVINKEMELLNTQKIILVDFSLNASFHDVIISLVY